MITDIMPLVDELHKLRNENAILRGSLNEQAVRMDQLISAGTAKPAWVTVKISPVELALRSESGQANYLRSELLRGVEAVLPELAVKVVSMDDMVVYHLPFLALAKA